MSKIKSGQADSQAQLIAELRQENSELLASGQRREQLLRLIGHQLRNPLGAISMAAQMMRGSGGNLSEDTQRLVELILRSVQRMDRMLVQLFEFERARRDGGMLLERTPTRLEEVCRQAADELALGSKIPILFDFVGKLSGSWDGGSLTVVISNLLSHALEHAAPETSILLQGRDEPSGVVLLLKNQGLPIAAELLPLVFAPFRNDSKEPPPKLGHLGMGLYIAHEIVRAHGGTLEVKCEGGTTTFTMRLPAKNPIALEPL